ncbi:hypothetical protein [Mangrovibacillus cuniculi]|uniref:Uncharacterized protein n=1 Tax=Mangrovibacillus cuniculi TaxID=2593652 RepID=A0A7S8CAV1_9BACI|nr:hypothetical protein [Mangrovibacillus cuniculi]QPC46590.1 hypothetical protein G8O30_06230 [Mangrovibacillus cuniculi]
MTDKLRFSIGLTIIAFAIATIVALVQGNAALTVVFQSLFFASFALFQLTDTKKLTKVRLVFWASVFTFFFSITLWNVIRSVF